MKLKCTKEIKGNFYSVPLSFEIGEELEVKNRPNGESYISKDGFVFVVDWYNRELFKHFELIDEELEELMRRLKED